MNKKTLLIIGVILLLALLTLIYFFVIKAPFVPGNSPSNTSALFESVRNAVNQHLA